MEPPITPETCLYERIGGQEGLDLLLWHFYADIRQHELLGPIFKQHIKDWPTHLTKIASFWARQTGGPSDYPGGMAAKHMQLGVESRHFQAWLQLWEFNCVNYLKPAEAQEMIRLAQEIGQRLKSIVGADASPHGFS